MEGLQKNLDSIKDSMWTDRGQEVAESHNTEIRNHFDASTTAQLSQVAAAHAQEKAQVTLNNYTNAAVQDPANVERYAKMATDAIDNEYGSHAALKGSAGVAEATKFKGAALKHCLLYTSPSPRDRQKS